MTRKQKDNTGALFINHKRDSEKHPSMKGSCRIDGFDYWISGWTKQTEAGEKYLSLAFNPKEKKTVQQKIKGETNTANF